MSVEVERKFVCDVDIKKKLELHGAVFIGQSKFEDQYFDTPDFNLTLNDVWLRCRQGCWELKCPTVCRNGNVDKEPQEAALCSRYTEITNLPQIQLKVREALNNTFEEQKTASDDIQTDVLIDKGRPKSEDKVKTLSEEDSWLRELNLVVFAEFTTERSSYNFHEEQVRVDLDSADFGYCVGEIEVIVPEGKKLDSALKQIENTAKKLGLSGTHKVQGKIEVYLQRNCPEHYAKLLEEHIL